MQEGVHIFVTNETMLHVENGKIQFSRKKLFENMQENAYINRKRKKEKRSLTKRGITGIIITVVASESKRHGGP